MQKLLIITQKIDKNDQLLGFFIDWIARFSQKFDKVTVLCLEKGEFTLPGNVRVISLGKDRGASKLKLLFNFYSLIFVVHKEYDAVFVHMNPLWVVLGGWYWRLMQKKIFFWYTSGGITTKLKLAEKFADTIFTASSESFRLPSKKVIVTGHGIDTDFFKPNLSRSNLKDGVSRFDLGGIKILSVGRMSPVKNYETLVRAAKILKDKNIEFSITIIGEPALKRDKDYEQKLKLLIDKLGLQENFNFLGKINHQDLVSYYQNHHLFIHLSKTGSLDKTLLEAMSCGMNVLSSNDAARNFLPAELIFEENNAQELAKKIEKISIGNFKGQLRGYVIKSHSLPALIEKISRIINGVISGRNKILISGYAYADESSLKTFEYYPNIDDVQFLVPEMWPIKKGKHVFRPFPKKNIHTTKAFFSHSNYLLIGGILKGWMPMFPFVLIKQNPDIVFSVSEPNLLTTLYQGIFAKLFNAKHVIFTWENVSYELKFRGLGGIIQRFIVRLNLLLCDGLVCGSVKSQQLIKTLTDKPTAVIPLSGVDTDFFTHDYSKKSFQGTDLSNSTNFCFIGAMGYRKGVHLIVKAFQELVKNIVVNARLILAGSGEYEQEIDLMIKQSGLNDKITRVPWLDRNQVRELLNSSDVFLYPSIPHGGWEEQFGYSLIEASSMELPIITTESGSISEVVLNGETGILIKPNDHKALLEAMEILANDKEKRMAMGKAGRQFVLNNYSHQVVSNKFYNFFEQLK